MIDDNTSIFDKENRPFLAMSLIQIVIIIGAAMCACLGR